jgi:DNA polymerase-1
MNQPTRSEDGKLIRKAFEAREGAVLVSNDLSQIEFRVLADQSGDSKLLHVFRNGLDIHSITASNIFKLPVDKLDDMLHRYPSKRVGFGVVYGITKEGLQEQLLMVGLDPKYWTLERCQNLIDDWFSTYPGVEVYMNDLVAFALRHGYVEDMFGRRRYLPTLRSSSRLTRAEAVRQAGNMPIQSGAAGIFKKAMKNLVPIYRDFQSQGYICHPVIPIHDDLVFEVSEEIVHLWVPLCQDVMEHSVIISVPVLSEAKVGKTWGDQEKYRW